MPEGIVKKKRHILFGLILLLAIVIFVGATYVLRVPICKGRYMPFARDWVHLFLPPEDLYTSRLDEHVNVSKCGSNKYEISFNYIVPYRASIFPRDVSDKLKGKEYDTTLEMSMEFYIDDKSVLKIEPMVHYDEFWGLGSGHGPTCKIQIPTELPLDTKVTCVLTVIEPDEYLNKNSNMRIIIGKQSEL